MYIDIQIVGYFLYKLSSTETRKINSSINLKSILIASILSIVWARPSNRSHLPFHSFNCRNALLHGVMSTMGKALDLDKYLHSRTSTNMIPIIKCNSIDVWQSIIVSFTVTCIFRLISS